MRLGREDGGACDFLGLPYDDAMLSSTKGGRRRISPRRKQAWRPVTPGLRDWGSQMTLDDIERFEAAAGDLLDELGYPRAVPNPPQEKLEIATGSITPSLRRSGRKGCGCRGAGKS